MSRWALLQQVESVACRYVRRKWRFLCLSCPDDGGSPRLFYVAVEKQTKPVLTLAFLLILMAVVIRTRLFLGFSVVTGLIYISRQSMSFRKTLLAFDLLSQRPKVPALKSYVISIILGHLHARTRISADSSVKKQRTGAGGVQSLAQHDDEAVSPQECRTALTGCPCILVDVLAFLVAHLQGMRLPPTSLTAQLPSVGSIWGSRHLSRPYDDLTITITKRNPGRAYMVNLKFLRARIPSRSRFVKQKILSREYR